MNLLEHGLQLAVREWADEALGWCPKGNHRVSQAQAALERQQGMSGFECIICMVREYLKDRAQKEGRQDGNSEQ